MNTMENEFDFYRNKSSKPDEVRDIQVRVTENGNRQVTIIFQDGTEETHLDLIRFDFF